MPLETATQDGTFFEKSWAFNFGPTGGMLIGMGPVELMAEAQILRLVRRCWPGSRSARQRARFEVGAVRPEREPPKRLRQS
jgi:hypothetical protein